jgi:NADPH:quinone reductase-like Zn-dependent oxidoreductase
MNSMMLWGLEMPLEPVDISIIPPREGEAVVRLRGAALNKRDYWITKGKYPGLAFPMIPGSDGAGVVLGGNQNGREVIINPSLDWGDDPDHFSSDFRILGMPDYGTFSYLVKVPEENLFEKPLHLSWVESAALPVCGVTAYRAMMTRGRAKSGERMLITGIGGGVATMALLFGVAHGMEVWVSSSSDNKIDQAILHGAAGGGNYTRPNWDKELAEKVNGKFDLVIDGAGGSDFSRIVPLMNNRGRMVMYGGTRGNIDGLSPQRIFWKQLDILGSTMGSPEDFNHMLSFVNQHKIKPIISHVFPLEQVNDAMAIIAGGEQFGKVCLDIPAE